MMWHMQQSSSHLQMSDVCCRKQHVWFPKGDWRWRVGSWTLTRTMKDLTSSRAQTLITLFTQYRNNPEDGVQEILNLDAPPPATTPQFMEPLPHPFGPPEFSFKPPQGITLKERAVIVLTAQFVARNDMHFFVRTDHESDDQSSL